MTDSKAEIYATGGDWKSEMHVSRLDGSWNETDSDFKVRFPSSSELFANDMMPKDQLTTANDIDCKMALTVIEFAVL